MPRSRFGRLVLLIVSPLAGCKSEPLSLACPDIGWVPVLAEIRNQDGQPAAVGATVRLERHDGYADQVWGFADPLHVGVGEPVTGIFDATVVKPYHTGETVHGVEVKGEPPCGIPAEPARPRLIVRLNQDAPPVRQVVVPPYAYGFGDGNITSRITAKVEADEGISRDVVWVSRDTTVAHVSLDGMITSVCRATPGSTFLVASAVAAPEVNDSVPVDVSISIPTSGRCP